MSDKLDFAMWSTREGAAHLIMQAETGERHVWLFAACGKEFGGCPEIVTASLHGMKLRRKRICSACLQAYLQGYDSARWRRDRDNETPAENPA